MRVCSLLLSSLLLLVPPAVAQGLQPRTPLAPGPVVAPIPNARVRAQLPEGWGYLLTVKFADDARVRADGQGGVLSRSGADLSAVQALAADTGARFRAVIGVDEDRLAALEARGAARTGRAQPDLAGILGVDLPGDAPERLERVGQRLADLPVVEFASVSVTLVPPPGDLDPTTPDLTADQVFFGPDPGLDVDEAWSQGLRGAGIRMSDCEYAWYDTHEDLNDVDLNPEPGQTPHPDSFTFGFAEHGTAVLGETSAAENAYGVTGMVPDAEVHTYTEWSVEDGFRRLAAVSGAITDSSPGDVVMLEMQAVGAGGDYGPAELDPPIYTVCSAGTAAGIVIVGAAGNGNQDLDSAPYASYKAMPDSGAILVGAGSADTLHAKLSFSTFGSRVDVQGWGEDVFSLGYGDAFAFGGPTDPDQFYTATFNGTSSATPFVTACCVILQQQALAVLGEPLDPGVLRYVVAKTGIPQAPGPRIGPFPDLPEALAALPDLQLDPWVDLGSGLAGTAGLPQQTGTGALFPGTLFQISLTNARAFAFAWQLLGVSEVDAPFKGGVLVPAPDFLFGPVVVPFNGAISYKANWPVGLPPGVPTFWQFWIQDPVGPKGFAASNALSAVSQ